MSSMRIRTILGFAGSEAARAAINVTNREMVETQTRRRMFHHGRPIVSKFIGSNSIGARYKTSPASATQFTPAQVAGATIDAGLQYCAFTVAWPMLPGNKTQSP